MQISIRGDTRCPVMPGGDRREPTMITKHRKGYLFNVDMRPLMVFSKTLVDNRGIGGQRNAVQVNDFPVDN